MEKPITVRIDEFKQSIVGLINNSGIPIVILQLLMKQLYEDVSSLAAQQAEQERKAWEDEQKKQESTANKTPA